MPRSGYKTITIKENVHKKLSKEAESQSRSIPEEIEWLINQAKGV